MLPFVATFCRVLTSFAVSLLLPAAVSALLPDAFSIWTVCAAFREAFPV